MNTTATDAIEELEQLVEIGEAGYRLVMTWAVADSTAGGPEVQKSE